LLRVVCFYFYFSLKPILHSISFIVYEAELFSTVISNGSDHSLMIGFFALMIWLPVDQYSSYKIKLILVDLIQFVMMEKESKKVSI